MLTKIRRLMTAIRGTKHLEVMTYSELEEAIYGSTEANFASLTDDESLEAMRLIKRY